MSVTFEDTTQFRRFGPGSYLGRFDESWYQGRGVYGGVVAAAFVRCLQDTVAEPRRKLRSLTVHFAAPARCGDVNVTTRLEREGSLVSHLSSRMQIGNDTVAIATATCAGARVSEPSQAIQLNPRPAPDVAAFDNVAPVESLLLPTFTQHFEYRFATGHAPFSAADRAHFGGWIRPRWAAPLDEALIVAMLDAFPPVVLAASDRPRPAASVDMTTHFYHLPPRQSAGAPPYLLLAETNWADDGYAEEKAGLYTADGTLIAECHQLVAVLG